MDINYKHNCIVFFYCSSVCEYEMNMRCTVHTQDTPTMPSLTNLTRNLSLKEKEAEKRIITQTMVVHKQVSPWGRLPDGR